MKVMENWEISYRVDFYVILVVLINRERNYHWYSVLCLWWIYTIKSESHRMILNLKMIFALRISCYGKAYINHVRMYRVIPKYLMFCSWSLKDSNGNLELAVAFLTAKNAKTPQQEETTYYQTVLPGSDRYISVGSQADASKFTSFLIIWQECNEKFSLGIY